MFHVSMKVNSVDNTTFKASRVNLLSFADNHGDILKIPQMVKAVQMHKKDVFEKATEKSTLNLMAIAGDFFMNPKKKGFLTNPEFCNGDIQYNFLQKLLYTAKACVGREGVFDAVYTPGNHCFDGGDQWLFDKMARSTITTIVSNVNKERSPIANNYIRDPDVNIVTSKEYAIPDNKDPNKVNKMLVLGMTIPSMNYYNPGLMEKTEFYDNSNKNDALLEEKDLRKTLRVMKYHIRSFKHKNPKGAVVVLSHMGNKISKIMAKAAPEINLILNGHDHKDFETMVGSTLILSHGQASNFFRASQMTIEDDGSVSIQTRKFDTEKYEQIARKDQKIQATVNINIKDDLVPLVKYEHPGATPEELVLDDSIRYSNSLLANYFTSALKVVAQDYFHDLDFVALPSTIIRNGLKSNEKRTTMNNMDFLKIFDGVNEDRAKLKYGTITGKQLYDLILENVLNNLKSRTRNALIQWSDIQINRTLIKSLKDDLDNPKLLEAIKIRNIKEDKFEPIDFNKEYKMLISDKYLLKDTANIKVPATIKNNFVQTKFTYEDLFREYLDLIDYNIVMTKAAREQRIL